MKNILIITDYFAPERSVASIRFTKIAKYLSRKDDCTITIITSRRKDFYKDRLLEKDLEEILLKGEVIEINSTSKLRNFLNNINKKYSNYKDNDYSDNKVTENKLLNLLKEIKNLLSSILIIYEGYIFSIRAKKELSDLNKYSIVISTFGFFGPHILARKIKKENKDIKWIADFRDPVIDFGKNIQWWCDRYCLGVTSNADEIVAVSDGMKDVLIIDDKQRINVIYNGFDDEELNYISTSLLLNDGKFHMVYTGSIYPRLDISPLFIAIQELIEEGKISKDLIRIDYAGISYEGFRKYANNVNLNLRDIIINHGYVDRNISLALQKESHIMILGAWNFKISPDVMTGKIYEYIMMRNPIVVLVNGDTVNGVLKKLISTNELGYCYESANASADFIKLKEYIYSQYLRFRDNIIVKLPEDKLSCFSYKNIAQKFYELTN